MVSRRYSWSGNAQKGSKDDDKRAVLMPGGSSAAVRAFIVAMKRGGVYPCPSQLRAEKNQSLTAARTFFRVFSAFRRQTSTFSPPIFLPMRIQPFQGLVPTPAAAPEVACVPYDV